MHSENNHNERVYGQTIISGKLPKDRNTLDALVALHKQEMGIKPRVPQLVIASLSILCATAIMLWPPSHLVSQNPEDMQSVLVNEAEFTGFGFKYKGPAVLVLAISGIAGAVFFKPKFLLSPESSDANELTDSD